MTLECFALLRALEQPNQQRWSACLRRRAVADQSAEHSIQECHQSTHCPTTSTHTHRTHMTFKSRCGLADWQILAKLACRAGRCIHKLPFTNSHMLKVSGAASCHQKRGVSPKYPAQAPRQAPVGNRIQTVPLYLAAVAPEPYNCVCVTHASARTVALLNFCTQTSAKPSCKRMLRSSRGGTISLLFWTTAASRPASTSGEGQNSRQTGREESGAVSKQRNITSGDCLCNLHA